MTSEFGKPENDSKNEIVWSIHQTNPELVQKVRTKLSEVIDPELGFDIIQLGLVRDFCMEDGTGIVKMILTTPFCPYGPEIIEMTKIKAGVALGEPVKVEMLPEIWDPSMMEDPTMMDWGLY